MQNTKINKTSAILIFIAVLFSSMTGGTLFGISLNKIALLPLEIYCFTKISKNGKIVCSKLQQILLLWYILIIVSCLFGMREQTTLIGFNNKLLLYIVQIIFILIPLLLLMRSIPNVVEIMKDAIVKVAFINAIWGIIQFVEWYIFKIDFNTLFFTKILKGIMGTEWTSWNFETGSLAIRVTGLNYDPAFFGMILILGYCFSRRIYQKALFIFAIILSMSRAAIVAIGILIIWDFIMAVKNHMFRLNIRKFLSFIIGTLGMLILVYIIYNKFEYVRYQIEYLLYRFSTINSNYNQDVGTQRHLQYVFLAVYIWFTEFGLLSKLFGVGARVSGLAFVKSNYVNQAISLTRNMKTNAWAIECSYADFLLGYGLIPTVVYFFVLGKIYKKVDNEMRKAIFSMAVMGIMYSVLDATLMQLLMIAIAAESSNYLIGRKSV